MPSGACDVDRTHRQGGHRRSDRHARRVDRGATERDGSGRLSRCRKTPVALRERICAANISRVAREAKEIRSVIKAFVNQGTVPHAATIARLQAALEQLEQRA